MVRAEVPGYDVLQSALAEATKTIEARAILDLGTGTGVTAARVLALHPSARLVGIDCSEEMLAHARQLLRAATLRVARLEDPCRPAPLTWSSRRSPSTT
jgi:tRNA (cmo5U34)-methyltransferase